MRCFFDALKKPTLKEVAVACGTVLILAALGAGFIFGADRLFMEIVNGLFM